MCVLEQISRLIIKILSVKLDSGILRQWSASYNSSQTKMLYCQVHGKLTSKASREALTCYISSLKSIGSAVAEL